MRRKSGLPSRGAVYRIRLPTSFKTIDGDKLTAYGFFPTRISVIILTADTMSRKMNFFPKIRKFGWNLQKPITKNFVHVRRVRSSIRLVQAVINVGSWAGAVNEAR